MEEAKRADNLQQ